MGGGHVGIVLAILVVLGWLLLGLLAVILLIVAVVLGMRIRLAGRASARAELAEASGQDSYAELAWLHALDPAAAEAMGIDALDAASEDRLRIEIHYTAKVRLLGITVRVDEDGVHAFGRRWAGGSGGTGGTGRTGRRRTSKGSDRRRDRRGGPRADADRDGDTGAARHTGSVAAKIRDELRHESSGAARRGIGRWHRRRGSGRKTSVRLTWRDVCRLWPLAKQALLRSWGGLGLRLRARVTYGLDDPATTGILSGVAPAATAAAFSRINARRPGSLVIKFVPVFDREVLAGEVELRGDMRLIRLAWPLVRLALRREVRRLWWPRRRAKRSSSKASKREMTG